MRGHTLDIDSVTHRYGHVTAVADVDQVPDLDVVIQTGPD